MKRTIKIQRSHQESSQEFLARMNRIMTSMRKKGCFSIRLSYTVENVSDDPRKVFNEVFIPAGK
jgi:hypothetical protein